MLGSTNRQVRFVAGLITLALALAVIPAISSAFAGAPVNPAVAPLSQGNNQQSANQSVVSHNQHSNAGANVINLQKFAGAAGPYSHGNRSAPTTTQTGHVIWQGIPQNNNNSMLHITLTLKSMVSPYTEYNYPMPGDIITTGSDGRFTFDFIGTSGTYAWRVKGPDGVNGSNTTNLRTGFLANCGVIFLPVQPPKVEADFNNPGPSSYCPTGCIRGGDADNNNVVNSLDFNILKNDWGLPLPRRGNFNNDGTVGASDFNILKSNFSQAGCNSIFAP